MTRNKHLAVLASLSALHYDRPREMQAVLKDYQPQDNIEGMWAAYQPSRDFPNSIWLETR